MNNNFVDRASHVGLIIGLMILAYFILMFGNGIISLTHPDEVFYAQTSKEMIAHNSWLTPMIFDEPQFEKPILFYWLLAVMLKIGGGAPFFTRFIPALFGMIGVGVTYWIAWMLFREKKVSLLSGVILSTSFIYMALSRAILTDMVFSIFVVISLGFFLFAYTYEKYKSLGMTLFFVFCAASVLTKGLLGICFAWATVLAFLAYKKDLKFLKAPVTFWGLGLFLLLSAPWHIAMYKLYGQQFVETYWSNVHVRRLFVAEHKRNDTWYFYLVLMFAGVMPWSFLTVPAGRFVYQSLRKASQYRDQLVFLLFSILCTYIFVQPAKAKLASYIFPVYPSIAIILSFYLNTALSQSAEKKRVISLQVIGFLMALLMLAGSVCAIYFSKQYQEFVPNNVFVYWVSGMLAVYGIGFLISALRKKHAWMIFLNVGITALVLAVFLGGKSVAEPWVSCIDISKKFKEVDRSDSVVLASKFYVRGVRYYTDRKMAVIDINGKGFYTPHPIPFLNTRKKVSDFLEKQPVTYGILKEGDVVWMERITKGKYKLEKIGEGIGGKYIIKVSK